MNNNYTPSTEVKEQTRLALEQAAAALRGESQTPPPQTFFESIAMPLTTRGWSVIPLFPKDKGVHTRLVPSPLTMKSNNPAQIRAWGQLEPFANVGVYAEQHEGGLLFLDKDGAVNLREKYERETGKPFPKTLLVRSSSAGNGIAKGHWYFYQTPRTLALPKNIGEELTGGLFSLRVKNQYVASIGSIHPTTGLPYTIVEDYPVIPMPDDLLDWLLKKTQKSSAGAVNEKPPVNAEVDGPPIPHGSHDNTLRDIARKLRGVEGLDEEELYERLVAICEKRCVNYGADYLDMCRKHARNTAAKFAPNPPVKALAMSGSTTNPYTPQETAQSAPQAAPAEPQPWGEVLPLDTILSPVLPFPLESLPLAIRPWCKDVAERMSVPLDFTAIAALVTLSGVVGRRAFVYPKEFDKDWKESIAISGGNVADSGKKKTPVWKAMQNPVVEQEMDWRREYAEASAKYEKARIAYLQAGAIVRDAEKKGKSAEVPADVAAIANGPEPQEPEKPSRLMLNDATPEKMHSQLGENPRGLLYYRDELASWVSELDKEGRETQRGIFLSAMNGDDAYAMDRIGRGEVFAIMCLTMCGNFQPEMLRNFLSDARNTQDGLVQRFPLLIWTDDPEQKRADRSVDKTAQQAYRTVVRALASMGEESVGLHFQTDAQATYNLWDDALETKIALEESQAKKSHMSKWHGMMPRVAALLQLVDSVTPVRAVNLDSGGTTATPQYGVASGHLRIDLQHTQMAIELFRYLESHMHRVYDSGYSRWQQAEAALAARIHNDELPDGMTARDIHRKHWAGMTKARVEDIEMALETLEELGWVRSAIASTPQGGRPTRRWEINPAAKGAF
jgi:hypothetical protein